MSFRENMARQDFFVELPSTLARCVSRNGPSIHWGKQFLPLGFLPAGCRYRLNLRTPRYGSRWGQDQPPAWGGRIIFTLLLLWLWSLFFVGYFFGGRDTLPCANPFIANRQDVIIKKILMAFIFSGIYNRSFIFNEL